MKTGIELIAQERNEQIHKHGRTLNRDVVENTGGQLSLGALMLLAKDYEEGIDSDSYPDGWDKEICRKMLSKPYKERLIIAGALLAAEIDRINEIYKSPEPEKCTNCGVLMSLHGTLCGEEHAGKIFFRIKE